MGATSASKLHTTTLLVPNLHCPSCVSNIEGALYALDPPPISISHSIVSHTVTVRHTSSLPIALICTALEDAGYDIDSIHADPQSADPYALDIEAISALRDIEGPSSNWAFPGVTSHTEDEGKSRKRKRHVENCELCRSEGHRSLDGKYSEDEKLHLVVNVVRRSSESSRIHKRKEIHTAVGEVVTQGREDHQLQAAKPEPIANSFEAEVSIAGMTCSSCSNAITTALQDLSWVQSVRINLINHSGIVRFSGDHTAAEIVEAIEDLGYDAAVQSVNNITEQHKVTKPLTHDSWKASYAIGGMTCSSCSGAITHALKNLPWVKSVDVNLIGNSATIVFEGRSHLDEIGEAIGDIGYDAKLDEVVTLAGQAAKQTQRKIAVRINGMYCEHCPQRIKGALQVLDPQISIEMQPSMARPIINLTYTPKPPTTTIRMILTAISSADPAFEPYIYHPMTIEERSRLMQAREQRHLLARVVLTLLTAIPTFIIGIVYMDLVPPTNSGRVYLMKKLHGVSRAEWALFIMATPVYFFAADIFHRRTLKELRALWRPGSPIPLVRRFVRFGSMNMLVSMGTTIAYVSSIAILIVSASRPHSDMNNTKDFYFDSVVFLTMFLLIGRWMEAYSKGKAGDAVSMLGKLRPTEALLVQNDEGSEDDAGKSTVTQISVDLLEFGDVVKVQHGSSPPCDGVIAQGESKFDESSLTGEAKLIEKAIGDQVFAGTINQGGAISIRVTGVAGSSMLDQIMKVVREGQTRRAPVERLADVITGHFVPFVTLIAVLTWIIWLALGLSGTLPDSYLDTDIGGWPYWSLQFAIAVFVVACPCGIGLAAPTALFVGGGLAAKYGILVKGGGEAFQEASNLDCIVFDKTGTLTMGGEPVVTDHQVFLPSDEVMSEERLFGMMKRLEEDSSHPIAKAVVDFCQTKARSDVTLKATSEIAGKGMCGTFIDANIPSYTIDTLIGNETLMNDHNVPIPALTKEILDSWKAASKSVVLVATKISTSHPTPQAQQPFNLTLILSTSDPLRPSSRSLITALHARNLTVYMLTGDNPATAHAVGAQLNIPPSNIIAGVLPAQKADKIKYLQKSHPSRSNKPGRRAIVAMVGDGVNDAPALAAADVGIALASGSDVAVSAAAFVLVSPRLDVALLTLLDLSRAVLRRIKFNFAWALVYNLIGLPVAAGVLYPIVTAGGQHVRLDPVWAALAMALSSVSVVGSSLLLRTRVWGVGFRGGVRAGAVE